MQVMTDQENVLAAWVLPIAGDAPSGVDARYEPGYELVRAELAKLDAPTAPPVDWAAVRVAAEAILRGRSKDLYIAAALARALHVEQGIAGLSLGLALIGRLTTEFGGALFPSRARARASALHWLSSQVARPLGEYAVALRERELVETLRLHFDECVEGVRSLLADDAPNFSELRDAISRMQLSLPAAAPASEVREPAREATPQPSAAPPAPIPQASASANRAAAPAAPPPQPSRIPATAAASAPTGTSEVSDFLGKTGAALTEAARILWREDRTSAVPYRLLRASLWLHLEQPPAHDARGMTAIPAPEERLAESLKKMLQHGAWEELLEISEATLVSARFWLDLHLFCDRALEGLGPTFEGARAAAQAGVHALLARMPMLPRLSFADGTPLAGPETASFLERLPESGRRASSDTQDGLQTNALDALRSALRGSQSAQALQTVEERRRACHSARQRFALDVELASALAEGARPATARALFEALDADLQRHALETWEPALALSMLTAYMRCLLRLEKADLPSAAALQNLRVRVAKLSPVALVSLGD